jgi:hypothetical protein
MVNWQAHAKVASTNETQEGQATRSMLSADFIGFFRTYVEENTELLVAYYSGASGNLNFISVIPGERKHPSIGEAAAELLRATREALGAEESVKTGKLVTATTVYKGRVRHDTDERIAQAQEVRNVGRDTPEGVELIKKYDFVNKYEPGAILYRATLGETLDVHFFAVAFGDVAISGVPFEQFDTNAQEVRAASPFQMTFTLSMVNESYAYVASALADFHHSYEVAISKFVPGSGTEFAAEQLRLLQACKA